MNEDEENREHKT